ncbi:amino acid ABC transporter substrate-binding protein [Clostridia bacterium]|nr:amino acid ABC transporter substrate-binding protein [Clostridia bacterium]
MKAKRIFVLVMAVVLCLGVFAGCSGKNDAKIADLDKIHKAGKIVVGITDYEPMNYYEANGSLTGFDTEYTRAVAEVLGVEAEFIEIDWDNKEIELNAGNIDAIWNGMTYTEERAKNMDFSKPYVLNEIVLVVRADDAEKYRSTADLASAKIVAEGGSSGEDCVAADENLKNASFTPVDGLIFSLMEVAAGTADAAAVDSVMARRLVGNGAYANLVIIPDVVLSDEVLAIAFRKGSDLSAEVDKITADLVKDGTIKALAEKYALTLVLE